MRKSLGNKRNEICDEQRNEIIRFYGDFKENEHVRIFHNRDFGFNRITVERPLRLNFRVDEERIVLVKETNAFVNLAVSKKKNKASAMADIAEGIAIQEGILDALRSLASDEVYHNRDTFTKLLKKKFKEFGLALPAPLFKAILMALSERNETSDICTDAKGNPEPDTDLRDYENVPLKEDIDAYMVREVLPHVPDAWVDKSKTKVGYEINFNRYFYKYIPPRPLEEIEADLKMIEKEIADMLSGAVE
jgi:type I restriction enzyme M protein